MLPGAKTLLSYKHMDPHIKYVVKPLNHPFVLDATYYPKNWVCCAKPVLFVCFVQLWHRTLVLSTICFPLPRVLRSIPFIVADVHVVSYF